MSDNIIVTGNVIKFLKDSVVNSQKDIITITIDKVISDKLMDEYTYQVSTDGSINIPQGDTLGSYMAKDEVIEVVYSKDKLIRLLKDMAFESVPRDLTEDELQDIYNYSVKSVNEEYKANRVHTFKVETIGEQCIRIVLIIFNNSEVTFNVAKLPLTLRDALNRVVFSGLVDIDEKVNPGKIGICQVKVPKESLLEANANLISWTITFEM
jgi:SLAP domain-containing protein